MPYGRIRSGVFAALVFFACSAFPAGAQIVPWDVFEDTLSDSVCDVVNAANAELVVLSDTGQLVIVTGLDVTLEDTFVDLSGFVFFEGLPVGLIDFAEDGDGFRTLWWTSLTGRVVDVSGFTGEPAETELFPSDISGVPCDACDFWDDPAVCGPTVLDGDLDGILDEEDFCVNTPINEVADEHGCSCSQLDDDLDGVDNCADLCPSTPLGEEVNDLGCLRISTGPIVSICGSFSNLTLAMMFCGLVALRAISPRA
jgi:hypothetical protein